MISDIISIIDKLRSYNREHKKDKKELFLTLVEPTYIDMTKIHNDYLNTFHKIKKDLVDEDLTTDYFQNYIIDKKIELEHLRVKVFELSKVINESDKIPTSAKIFFNACLTYFKIASGRIYYGNSYKSYYSDLLEYMNEETILQENKKLRYEDKSIDKGLKSYESKTFGDVLGRMLAQIRIEWSEVSASYSKCKLDLI